MRRTQRTSRIRPNWPPPELQPPWPRLFGGDLDLPAPPAPPAPLEPLEPPVIAHLGTDQIAQQLVELIQDEAGGLETDARAQVAQRIIETVRPWLRQGSVHQPSHNRRS